MLWKEASTVLAGLLAHFYAQALSEGNMPRAASSGTGRVWQR